MSPENPQALKVAALVLQVLDELAIRYHLGGSYASSVHGVPRQTHDVDVVVELLEHHVPQLVAALETQFYADEEILTQAVKSHRSAHLIHLKTGIKIDLFVSGDGKFDHLELERSRRHRFSEEPFLEAWVKSAEDTILRKLQWYEAGGRVSDRQWEDVRGVVSVQGDRLDRPYLLRWAQELGVEDLLQRALDGEEPLHEGEQEDENS